MHVWNAGNANSRNTTISISKINKKGHIMKKLILILLVFVILIAGCRKNLGPKTETKTLSDMQITACNAAHEARTCDTRLAELGIVLKEDCCKVLGKCC